MTAEQARKALGVEPGASDAAIKIAYRDLVKAWHPDRFENDLVQQREAEEELKRINAAYQILRKTAPEPNGITDPAESEERGPFWRIWRTWRRIDEAEEAAKKTKAYVIGVVVGLIAFVSCIASSESFWVAAGVGVMTGVVAAVTLLP